MVDYREILRLDYENCSLRSIAASIQSSHHTVSDTLKAAKEKHIEWPLDEVVTNAQLEEILFPDKYYALNNYLVPDFEHIHKELAKPGVTLTLLWTEYVHECEACRKRPYMTTQFGDKYRAWAKITKATMRISHKPGDAMEVDWAGNTLSFHDSATGEISLVYLFIAALPCSCFTYAEACTDMKTENWLACHVHAYEYFGGVTRLLIPDNLKTGVTKNTRYETVLNRSYHELAEYYNTAVVPARVAISERRIPLSCSIVVGLFIALPSLPVVGCAASYPMAVFGLLNVCVRFLLVSRFAKNADVPDRRRKRQTQHAVAGILNDVFTISFSQLFETCAGLEALLRLPSDRQKVFDDFRCFGPYRLRPRGKFLRCIVEILAMGLRHMLGFYDGIPLRTRKPDMRCDPSAFEKHLDNILRKTHVDLLPDQIVWDGILVDSVGNEVIDAYFGIKPCCRLIRMCGQRSQNAFSSSSYADDRVPTRSLNGLWFSSSSFSRTAFCASETEKNLRSRKAAVIHVETKRTVPSTAALSFLFSIEDNKDYLQNQIIFKNEENSSNIAIFTNSL